MEFVDGDRFDLALQGMSEADVQQASASAGAALASIHDFGFERAGLFGPGLEVVSPMGGSWLPMVERGMSDGGRPRERVGAELADRLLRLIDAQGHRLEPQWSQARLLHCDYKPWNMLARQSPSGWHVTAVLDWEFAAAGPPLCDFGIYLRYADRHPSAYTTAFVDGYRDAGGTVPDDAARLCRLVDLVNVCTFLERPEDDAAITQEMQRVILATLEAFNQ
jgi:hypothetical protein